MRVPYFEQSTSRQAVHEKVKDKESIGQIIELLDDKRLEAEALHGNITMAIIRPDLERTTLKQSGSDSKIAERIEEDITGLGVLAKFSLNLDDEAYDDLYGQYKELLQRAVPESRRGFANRWVEFKSANTNGPCTVLLLYSPDHDAISKWRDQVGHRDVVTRRDIGTIRGRYAKDNYSNIVHGSDSPESVVKEIGIVKDCLKRSVDRKIVRM